MFFQFFSAISEVIVSETQYILSEWLHTAYQMVFNQKYSNFKIRSIFRVYLENSPVNTFDQPHGSDQCGYIHLLHGSDLMETVVRVGNLCRLGWTDISGGQWTMSLLVSSVDSTFVDLFSAFVIMISFSGLFKTKTKICLVMWHILPLCSAAGAAREEVAG